MVVTTPAGIRVPAPLQHLTAHITRLIASFISHTAAISRDQARRCCCRPPSPDCDGAPSVLAARHSNVLNWHNISQDWHDPMLLPSSPVTCVCAHDIITRIHTTQHVTGQVVVDLHASQHHGARPLHVHALYQAQAMLFGETMTLDGAELKACRVRSVAGPALRVVDVTRAVIQSPMITSAYTRRCRD